MLKLILILGPNDNILVSDQVFPLCPLLCTRKRELFYLTDTFTNKAWYCVRQIAVIINIWSIEVTLKDY